MNANKGIIFDLDGTLWDSSENVVRSWNEVLDRRAGKTITVSEMQGYMGKTLKKIGELMLPDISDDLRSDIMRECCENEQNYLSRHGGKLFPELENVLKQLSERYKLFIVSNCQSGYIEVFLEYSGLGKYFTDHECPGGSGLEKAGNIRLVSQRNGLEKAVYIGDTQGDCDATEEAGIPFVHAAYGFGTIDHDVPKIFSLTEIEQAVKPFLDQGQHAL